jgi:integrase
MLRAGVEDFRFGDGTVIIREKKKSKRSETYRRQHLSPLLRAETNDCFARRHPGGVCAFCREAGRPLKETTAHEAFKWALSGGKWKVLRGYHIFRHSFASNLAAQGVDQREIEGLTGHQTEEMRRRYRHLSPEQRENAIIRVFGGKGAS